MWINGRIKYIIDNKKHFKGHYLLIIMRTVEGVVVSSSVVLKKLDFRGKKRLYTELIVLEKKDGKEVSFNYRIGEDISLIEVRW